MNLTGWLIAGAIALISLGLFGWHYSDLVDEADRAAVLDQQIKDRDEQAQTDAAKIREAAAKIAELNAARTVAEGKLLAVQAAIRTTAATTAEELARAIPDNPACAYRADVGRLLNDQLHGARPVDRH